MFGFAETALVNQAPAKSAPGLGPSGFDPHAFARPGLRAPLAPGQRPHSVYIVRYREKADSPGQPGRCNSPRPGSAHDSGNHPAVTHRPGKKPPGPWITASLALASDGPRSLGDFCVRWPLHRNAFGDQGGAPLDPQVGMVRASPAICAGLFAALSRHIWRDFDQLFRVHKRDCALNTLNSTAKPRFAP